MRPSQRCQRFQPGIGPVVLVFLLGGVSALTACTHTPWPLPVPEERTINGMPKRLELSLPVQEPPTCQPGSREQFVQDPGRCPRLKGLYDFLALHAERLTTLGEPSFTLDEALWTLMQALRSSEVLAAKPFPQQATALPEAIRHLRPWRVIDSRDATPPQGRPTVGLLYGNFWWTFWQKHPPPLRPPGMREAATPDAPFDTLIVFPEFPGRISKER